MRSMTTPIKLTVDERLPGQFVWTLFQTQADGSHPLVVRQSDGPVDSYELALASGQRALGSAIRERAGPVRT